MIILGTIALYNKTLRHNTALVFLVAILPAHISRQASLLSKNVHYRVLNVV